MMRREVNLTFTPDIDKYIDKERMEQKENHDSAATEVVTLADLLNDRHKEVWFLGPSWEHSKRRALHLPPLSIKTPIEHQFWNRARDSLKKKKNDVKKSNNRATNASTKPGKKQKPEPTNQVVLLDDDENEGNYQADDFAVFTDKYIKGNASAQELARLVHVMADESI